MQLQYDRKLTIATANNRMAKKWTNQQLYWSELVEKLHKPVWGTETLAEYLKLSKGKQDDLKDVGGFVGGILKDGQRKASAVLGRDIITLDMDNIPANTTSEVLKRIAALNCGYAVYSTRKHEPKKPRLRILFPMNRTVSVDEYEPIARKLAEHIGIEMCDPSTFQVSRLMYWPSCCSDGLYIFTYGDKPFLDPDWILAQYEDWKDISSWPQIPGEHQPMQKNASKQGDPTEKDGVVGAFCRIYDIYSVMDKFLPGVYVPTRFADRYTYTGGSTVGGAIVYDHGKFIYSHHATDPAGGRLCNAFDLVRLHKFGDLDNDTKPDTPTNRLPSYIEMCKLASEDPEVSSLLKRERYEKATEEFGNVHLDTKDNWWNLLQVSTATNAPLRNTHNVSVLLEHDPRLKGRIRKNIFTGFIEGVAPLPWGKRENQEGTFKWSDEDDAGLRIYVEKILGFRTREIIEDAVKNHAIKHGYNPVEDYLDSLEWDGVKRLDTLYIDYLGAQDNAYIRAVTRKAFVAGVARIKNPGCKFDTMTILTGSPGIGKSTLIRKMAGPWFNDSIKTFEGKEASEMLRGSWIIEIGELEAFNRSETERIKQFLSQQDDIYRPAYGRNVEYFPRMCIFFGTSNNYEYLKDLTGNRRFWPVDCHKELQKKDPKTDDLSQEIIDQIWAEAYVRWQCGETLYLPYELEKLAEEEQESHRRRSPREGLIIDFLNQKVPKDWKDWPLERRRMFWTGGYNKNDLELVERERVCALEIWCELFNGDFKGMRYADAQEINGIIAKLPSWRKQKNGARHGYCGYQRGFDRVKD